MTIDIDTKMRAAGERLRRSADAVPADTPPSPRSRVPLAAAAAVLTIAVVVAAVAFGSRDAGDRVDVATDPTTGSTVPDVSGDGRGGDLLHGEYPGGTWTVYIDADGRLCGATIADDRGSSVCGELDERAVTLRDNRGDPVALFGAMPEGATRLQVAMLEVCATEATKLSEPRDAPRVYALPTLGCEPGSVTFLDEDGNSVATEPVA